MAQLHVASVVDQVYLAIASRSPTARLPRGGRLHQEDLVEAAGNELVLQFVQNLWVSRIGAAIYELYAETPEEMRQAPTSTRRSSRRS